uniref:Uncharacterized protein n=1 Tax=Arion vulgaris TaxID=1028688 RepID=A0A0B7B0G8_9EUPU
MILNCPSSLKVWAPIFSWMNGELIVQVTEQQGMRWYDRVTSEKLMDRTRQIPVKQDTKKRHRCWI